MPGTISAVVATVAIARTEAAGAAVAARTRAAADVAVIAAVVATIAIARTEAAGAAVAARTRAAADVVS